ncbi:MAG TPA: hypothetical protein VII94_01280 [Candidatus Saccharimonadales bacterium]
METVREVAPLIEKLTNELDVEINLVWTEYIKLHEELDTHRGKKIDDTNLDAVNGLLKQIQEKFALLYPAYNFIATRHQYVANAVTSYNEFIETIKKSGAKQDGDDQPNIITS